MRTRLLAAPVLAALLALAALPRVGMAGDHVTFHSNGCDAPMRWASRHDPHDAHIAITTEDGDATLLLTDRVAAMQLSDQALDRVRRKLRREEDQDRGEDVMGLGGAIRTVVFTAVRELLDHSAELPVRDLRDVDYSDGRLHFVTTSGREAFEGIDVHDRDVVASFRERDAMAFVREFHRLKAPTR